MSEIGHNASLESYASRLEALVQEQRERADDIRELKKEAKDNGYDPKALATVVKEKMETAEKREKRTKEEDMRDEYRRQLGLIFD